MTAAYVIGLPDGFRGDPLLDQLAAADLDPVRIDGVRIRELPGERNDYVDDEASSVLMRRSMTDGEVGCALAHRAVYERMLADGIDQAFVFEDDARVVGRIDRDAVTALLDAPGARVVTFYGSPGYLVELEGEPSDDYRRAAVAPTTTTAYALNRAAAALLARANTPVRSVADWPPAAASHIDFVFPARLPVEPLPDASSLDADRADAVGAAPRGGGAIRRRVLALLHVTWFVHRRLYGDWATYAQHELLRMPAFGVALREHAAGRAPAGWSSMPLPLRLALRTTYRKTHDRA